MGKKNKKKHSYSDENEILNYIKKSKLTEMADQIEEFVEFTDKFLFIEGVTDEEYKKIMKHIRKAVKRLRKGEELEKVFDVEKIEECYQEDPSFAAEYMEID